ncbi:hypothetical protein BZG36_01253 [Bifiguratus adelaidae]|uniref:Glutathione hydrolase n=1 Tax=Bifiguratus adelaidae TaxID=1938954 RepID=A0A261Y5Q3_9FUNG|nr:hypothetical protein BZG36_01253 [Bifiguratus adelaidae]
MSDRKPSSALEQGDLNEDRRRLLDGQDADDELVNWSKPKQSASKGRWIGFGAVAVLAVAATLVSLLALNKLGYTDEKPPDRFVSPLIVAKEGAVAADVIDCSEIGVDILKDGGNAVDSAIATAICIGTIQMYSAGIGGGGFMLIRTANGTYEMIDFRESAPAAANETMFVKDPTLAQTGSLSVGVPGEIRGFQVAHERHGKLPWKRLFEPSIRLARYGWPVGAELARRLSLPILKEWLESDPEWNYIFAPNGTVLKQGDILKRDNLADTLELIANEGPDAFYKGRIAEELIEQIQAEGGILTMEDFASYEAIIREPLYGYYHGRKVVTGGVPTSGHVLLSVLNILERYNLPLDAAAHGRWSGLAMHRYAEALKFGYAFRTEMGDPGFVHNEERLEQIITKEWADLVRANITDNQTHEPDYYRPVFDNAESHGTTHLSTLDSDDMAVSLTSTVNLLFGARMMNRKNGVILNDEMDDFSIPGIPNAFELPPSEFNYVAPRKRPLSSSVPTIIERDGKFEMVLGASGGSRIITATLAAILNTLDYGMNILEAIDAPRLHHQLIPNVAQFESGIDPALVVALESRGHNVTVFDINRGVSEVQAVLRMSNGTINAASDWRKHGVAAGY